MCRIECQVSSVYIAAADRDTRWRRGGQLRRVRTSLPFSAAGCSVAQKFCFFTEIRSGSADESCLQSPLPPLSAFQKELKMGEWTDGSQWEQCMCMCVCVCERQRERERRGGGQPLLSASGSGLKFFRSGLQVYVSGIRDQG